MRPLVRTWMSWNAKMMKCGRVRVFMSLIHSCNNVCFLLRFQQKKLMIAYVF